VGLALGPTWLDQIQPIHLQSNFKTHWSTIPLSVTRIPKLVFSSDFPTHHASFLCCRDCVKFYVQFWDHQKHASFFGVRNSTRKKEVSISSEIFKFPQDYAVPHPRRQYSPSSPKTEMYPYIQRWRCLRAAELPRSWSLARRSCWNSEAKCPWRRWETWAYPKEKTIAVLNFSEEFGLIQAGIITLFEDNDSKEQRTAKTIQGTVRILACLLWGEYAG
jgi:hypothetical protein